MKITEMAPFVMEACRIENVKSGKIFARELRNAKLLNSGGHGVNAPDMTNKDLASFLIALLGTDKPARAVEMCEYLGSFQLSPFSDWRVGSSRLPADPDHTFRELMEALCDPQSKVPTGIYIEATGTTLISVKNENLPSSDEGSRTFVYMSRKWLDDLHGHWDGVDPGDYTSDAAKSAVRAAVDSPHSLHGMVTSRRISTSTIELIKTFMFPDHYKEELRDIVDMREAEK